MSNLVILYLNLEDYEASLEAIMHVWSRDFIPLLNGNLFFH